jgi:hypothetical protein
MRRELNREVAMKRDMDLIRDILLALEVDHRARWTKEQVFHLLTSSSTQNFEGVADPKAFLEEHIELLADSELLRCIYQRRYVEEQGEMRYERAEHGVKIPRGRDPLVKIAFDPSRTLVHIDGITWKGHEYINLVRDPKIWKKTKDGVKGLGSFSLELLGELAKGFIKTQIEKQTGLKL